MDLIIAADAAEGWPAVAGPARPGLAREEPVRLLRFLPLTDATDAGLFAWDRPDDRRVLLGGPPADSDEADEVERKTFWVNVTAKDSRGWNATQV